MDVEGMAGPVNSRKTFFHLSIAGLLLIAIFFSFFSITRSLGHDEACSVEISAASPAGIIENSKLNAHTPPLYYLFLAIWIKLFGISETALRSLSVPFYILSALAVYHLGKTLYDKKTGALAAFLYLVSPLAVRHTQEVRMYSLLSLLSVLSTFFFFRLFFFSIPSKKDLAGYILVNVAGTFTHYWFFFLLLSEAATCLFIFPGRSFRKLFLAVSLSVFPFFALWTPAFLFQLTNGGTSAMSQPGFFEFFNTLFDFFGGGKKGALVYAAALAVVLLEIRRNKIGFRPLVGLKEAFWEKQTLALVLLAAISLLIPLAVTQFTPIWIQNRYTIIALHPVLVLLGFFLGRFGRRAAVWAFGGALLASVLVGFIHRRINPEPFSHKSAYNYVARQAGEGDVWILSTINWVGIRYYQRLNKTGDKFQNFSFPSEMYFHSSWSTTTTWSEEKGRLVREADSLVKEISTLVKNTDRRIWLVAGYHPTVDRIIKNRLDRLFDPVQETEPDPFSRPFENGIFHYQKRGRLGESQTRLTRER